VESRWSPLSWLSFDGNLSYDRSDRRLNFFLDQGVKTEGFALGGPGEIRRFAGTTNAINAASSVNLLGKVGGVTLRSTLRALIERETNETSDATGTIFTAPGVQSLNNATQRFISSSSEEIRTNGLFLTGAADFGGRLILDGLVRRDGSSLFGPEERYNNYYRVSGAYRLAEESWWPWESVSEFKLRASRGTAGGRPGFSDQYESFSFASAGGLVKTTLGNSSSSPSWPPRPSWAWTPSSATATRCRCPTRATTWRTSCCSCRSRRSTAIRGSGRTPARWRGTRSRPPSRRSSSAGPQFTWRLGVVADRSRNRITEFDLPCFSTAEIAYRCAGETLGAMYGFRFIQGTGELPADAQARAAEFQRNDDGILVWVGPNNTFKDGETKRLWGTSTTIGTTNYGWGQPITLRDGTGSNALVRIGDGNPDFHFGISNNVSWRALSLFALVDANVGGQVYNAINQRMYQYGRSADVDQAGKPQELKKPVDYYVALYAATDPTSYFVEDAGFVKLREVSLRYRLGTRLVGPLARFGADGASLSLIGRNLLTFTDYTGYDPEVGNGIVRRDAYQYPRYRTITGSVEINF
jgi:hypothetical protein